MDQPPPEKNIQHGVPVDKPQGYADAPMGVPVAAPPAPSPYYAQAPQYDAYGRPVVNAVPMAPVIVPNNANIQRDAQGNALCRKCQEPYPLPPGCTSWRCRRCHELNNASIYGDECCTIL